MRTKLWIGIWLLDILQTHSDFEIFDHIDLQAKYGKYEQSANRNKGIDPEEHTTFRKGLIAAVNKGFINKVKKEKLTWTYQVAQEYKIMRVVDENKLMKPDEYYACIAWGDKDV